MLRRYTYQLAQSWLKTTGIQILIYLCLCPVLVAQHPYFVAPPVTEKLNSGQIQVIFESSDGFIWLGANEGLFRYDGFAYQPFALVEAEPISSQAVSYIFEAADHRIWVGLQNGRIYQATADYRLLPWARSKDLIHSPIKAIRQYQNQIIIATYGQGLFLFGEDNHQQITTEQGLYGNDIYDLHLSEKEGALYLATDRGINRISLTEQPKRAQNLGQEEGLSNYVFRSMEPDQAGGFFLGTYDHGVMHWSPQKKAMSPLLEDWKYGVVNELCLFKGRELWIATERSGLIQYNLEEQTHTVHLEINNLSTGKIVDLLKDQEGNLWLTSSSFKLLKTNRHFDFTEELPLEIKEILALWQDQEGDLWLGTGKGVYELKKDQKGKTSLQAKLKQIRSSILSFYQDDFGNIWMGTFGEGLYIYNEKRNKLRHLTRQEGLTDGTILSIDGSGDYIWVGTLAGLIQFKADENILDRREFSFQQFTAEDSLNAAFIYKVFTDSKNRIWLGTDGEGLYHIEGQSIKHYSGSDSLEFNAVYSIAEDSFGNIWFASLNQGLFRFDGYSIQKFGLEDGLHNLNITSLSTDGAGQLLITYPSGLDILDPRNLQVMHYNDEAGLSNLEQNLNVVHSNGNGDVWIGGKDKLIKYYRPRASFRVKPKLILDRINVSGNDINPQKGNRRFSHRQNTFVFSFVGIWMTAPNELQYRYRLEGLDEGWLYTRDQEVNYVNLPPGTYRFVAAVSTNLGFKEEPNLSYSFTVRPPFWKTLWFIALLGISLTSGFVFFLHNREKRIMTASRLKREKIENQFEVLKSQINPHFLFNSFNTLVAIIEENPDQAVRYVERLSDFYRSILQYRNKPVIPLEEEITLIKNYFYLLEERFGKNLSLDISVHEKEAYIPPLSLQLLVENAIKHNVVSAIKPLQISIHQDHSGHLLVKNNLQLKRVKSRSTSFGLSSIIARYALLSEKKVRVDQTKQEFIVRLPLIKSEYAKRQGLHPTSEKDSFPSKTPQT